MIPKVSCLVTRLIDILPAAPVAARFTPRISIELRPGLCGRQTHEVVVIAHWWETQLFTGWAGCFDGVEAVGAFGLTESALGQASYENPKLINRVILLQISWCCLHWIYWLNIPGTGLASWAHSIAISDFTFSSQSSKSLTALLLFRLIEILHHFIPVSLQRVGWMTGEEMGAAGRLLFL